MVVKSAMLIGLETGPLRRQETELEVTDKNDEVLFGRNKDEKINQSRFSFLNLAQKPERYPKCFTTAPPRC